MKIIVSELLSIDLKNITNIIKKLLGKRLFNLRIPLKLPIFFKRDRLSNVRKPFLNYKFGSVISSCQ